MNLFAFHRMGGDQTAVPQTPYVYFPLPAKP